MAALSSACHDGSASVSGAEPLLAAAAVGRAGSLVPMFFKGAEDFAAVRVPRS
jgi:hypothetical protein